MRTVLVFLNKHKQEKVFAAFSQKSGKPSENIADMPPADTVCVFFQDPHHQEASFLQDYDTHLSLVRLLIACCFESPDVLSNTFRLVSQFGQEAHHIHHTLKLFHDNKNIQ